MGTYYDGTTTPDKHVELVDFLLNFRGARGLKMQIIFPHPKGMGHGLVEGGTN